MATVTRLGVPATTGQPTIPVFAQSVSISTKLSPITPVVPRQELPSNASQAILKTSLLVPVGLLFCQAKAATGVLSRQISNALESFIGVLPPHAAYRRGAARATAPQT